MKYALFALLFRNKGISTKNIWENNIIAYIHTFACLSAMGKVTVSGVTYVGRFVESVQSLVNEIAPENHRLIRLTDWVLHHLGCILWISVRAVICRQITNKQICVLCRIMYNFFVKKMHSINFIGKVCKASLRPKFLDFESIQSFRINSYFLTYIYMTLIKFFRYITSKNN
jgi:hypothetical protein